MTVPSGTEQTEGIGPLFGQIPSELLFPADSGKRWQCAGILRTEIRLLSERNRHSSDLSGNGSADVVDRSILRSCPFFSRLLHLKRCLKLWNQLLLEILQGEISACPSLHQHGVPSPCTQHRTTRPESGRADPRHVGVQQTSNLNLKTAELKQTGALPELTPLLNLLKPGLNIVDQGDRDLQRMVPGKDPFGLIFLNPPDRLEEEQRVRSGIEGVQTSPVDQVAGIQPVSLRLIEAAVARRVARRVNDLDAPASQVQPVAVP